MRGYKVFKPDWTCRGGFKYTCPGKFEEDVKPEVCSKGLHFCKKISDCFDYYSFNPNNHVAEIEAYGDVTEKGNKCSTNKIEIIREIPWSEVLELCNTGHCNTGNKNTGHCNTGNKNTGNWNTGNKNIGHCNTGNKNTGGWNTGNKNTGNWNTGNKNIGHCNTGNKNTGSWNTGNWNTGGWNTGSWNKSSFNTGCFNTKEQNIYMFNKPSEMSYRDWNISDASYLLNSIPKNVVEWICSSDMTDKEKEANPSHEITGGYLKILEDSECAQMWWDDLDELGRNTIRSIPNFDEKIFEEITGIKM